MLYSMHKHTTFSFSIIQLQCRHIKHQHLKSQLTLIRKSDVENERSTRKLGEGEMNTETLQNAEEWAVETDRGRQNWEMRGVETRLVKIVSALGEHPSVSLRGPACATGQILFIFSPLSPSQLFIADHLLFFSLFASYLVAQPVGFPLSRAVGSRKR